MALQLKVPSLGESITRATIGAWLKREGDAVQVDEPLVEVESEKATVAVPSPAAGVLRKVLRRTGEEVAIGEVIAELDTSVQPQAGAAPRAAVQAQPAPTAGAAKRNGQAGAAPAPAPTVAAGPAASVRPEPLGSGAHPAHPEPLDFGAASGAYARGGLRAAEGGAESRGEPSQSGLGPRRASPSARRLMAEHGLAAGQVASEAGAVRKDDVLRALEPGATVPAQEARAPAEAPGRDGGLAARERIVPMTPLRRTVARRLVEAQQTAAILTTFNEVDMSRVLALRERHGEAFQERHGVKLGFMSFFVKAAVEGLRAFPAVNAEVRGTDVVYKDHYDIGVAVGGGKGLVVPVVRDADQLSFAEIEKAIGELARKARENRITMDDLEGGTFTISNGGIYGSLLSTPILNPPQSGILGLHKIEKRAVALPGDVVGVRPMMYLALSYDHRVVDGREAVSFLVKVKETIEDPERVLLEV